MLFNSLEFAFFLPVVFFLYWFVFKKHIRYQNLLIVVASYFFYGWWDWRFLILIFVSSLLDFFVGKSLYSTQKEGKRKLLLISSLIVNIGFLAYFKYFNFFLESFSNAFQFFGASFSLSRLEIILPVGISFYTFQTLSYTIDIYRKKLKPTESLLSFLAFVSFFPQLVAGPIERATHLLPQFHKKRYFSYAYAKSGIQLIIWGLFKKVVIADNAAIIVDGVYSSYADQSTSSLLVAAVFFSFQIYGDFSGYSDIAIGTARLFGFDLMTNFKFPYLSKDIGEHWKRWHISLSTWFRDYVYIPLGGSKKTLWIGIRNVFIIFIVSGFWHGANWTFIIWALIHALLYIPVFIKNKLVKTEKQSSRLVDSFKIVLTFLMITFSFVFFRADSITDSLLYLKKIFINNSEASFYVSSTKYKIISCISAISILFLMIVEYIHNRKENYEVRFHKFSLILLCLVIAFIGALKNHVNFIYFQF